MFSRVVATTAEAITRGKIAIARKLWDAAGPIDGSPGEFYLAFTRGIGSAHWPSSLRWNDRERVLVFAVTDTAGQFVGAQIVAVTANGQKDANRRDLAATSGRALRMICEGYDFGVAETQHLHHAARALLDHGVADRDDIIQIWRRGMFVRSRRAEVAATIRLVK